MICGGGGTLYEFCFLGKPILAIGQNIREKEVIDFLSKNNYVYKITNRELNVKKMFKKMILNFVKNKILLRNLSKKASNLIDKKNYYKIVNDLI